MICPEEAFKEIFIRLGGGGVTDVYWHLQAGNVAGINPIPLDVNGLIPGNHYTDAQIRAALGQPTRFQQWDDEVGGGREYKYATANDYDVFRCSEATGFDNFGIKKRSRVSKNLTLLIENCINRTPMTK